MKNYKAQILNPKQITITKIQNNKRFGPPAGGFEYCDLRFVWLASIRRNVSLSRSGSGGI